MASILNLIFLILNAATFQSPTVTINEGQITYPSFPKRKIQWNELNNIILKDGLFTIDFKNDNLIQQMIEDRAGSINEKEFNEFCQQQLNK